MNRMWNLSGWSAAVVVAIACLLVLPAAAHSGERPRVFSERTSGRQQPEWMNFYLVSGFLGAALDEDEFCSAVTVVGFRGSIAGWFAFEYALGEIVQPGEGRGRWSIFPAYLHFMPVSILYKPDRVLGGADGRLLVDVFAGGCAWAQPVDKSLGSAVFGRDGYLHTGVRVEYVALASYGSLGLEFGHILSRASDGEERSSGSSYLGVFFSLGAWL